MEIKGKVVWITGASSGIGEAFAYEMASMGAKVILSARRAEALDRVKAVCEQKGGKADVVTLDLASPETIDQAFEQVKSISSTIDILFNNGGISQRSLTWETDLAVDRRIMEVNFFGNIHLTKLVLPLMRQQKQGMILVTSSVVGKFGFPLRSAYAASKHALHGFFDSLRAEITDEDIHIMLICPGRIKTNISLNALSGDGTNHGEMDQGQAKGMSAEQCAKIIFRAMRRKTPELYIGKEKIMIYLRRYIPALYYRMAKRVSAK